LGWHRAIRKRAVESASNAETACVEGDRERDAGSFQSHSLRADGVLSLCARYGDFTRFFTHSGTREVRSREALGPLLILDLFGEATISPKLQLLSGHAEEKSLAIYRDLALADVSGEYEQAMRSFPVR
jgi:hypothetical protein